MASSTTTKAARKAAREATIAAQEAVARRTRANMDDLTVFFSARQRADAVDDWLKDRVAALKVQADERRAGQLRECGVALRAMRDRGETVREIARMASTPRTGAVRVADRRGAARRRLRDLARRGRADQLAGAKRGPSAPGRFSATPAPAAMGASVNAPPPQPATVPRRRPRTR
jgi:hypothetical protein